MITIITSILLMSSGSRAQTGTALTPQKAVKWYEQHAWLKGIDVVPHKSIDKLEFSKQYHAHKIWWDKAFVFLNRKDLASLKVGEYPIVGKDVFAKVTSGTTRDKDKSEWESHRHYTDIHYVIEGKELLGVAPVSSLTVTLAYNDAKDKANYTGEGTFYLAKPGTFFIMFPRNAHRPGVKVDQPQAEKRLVIKVKSGL